MGKVIRNIMKKIKDSIRNKIMALAIAFSNVERNAFSQKEKDNLDEGTNSSTDKDTGTLLNSLKNNVITEEVKNLRWRTYKILTKTRSNTTPLKDIMVDPSDDGTLEMVIDNTPNKLTNDTVFNTVNLFDKPIITYNTDGTEKSASHGEISDLDFKVEEQELPITVIRNSIPKFNIEKYTHKLHVREIDGENKLLEFYVSKYPDANNRTSNFFISELKKTIQNPRASSLLDILGVKFITLNSIGVDDFYEYEYTITSFDKIVEFNGFYLIKFKAKVVTNGNYIVEQFRMKELDDKYLVKAKKKITI